MVCEASDSQGPITSSFSQQPIVVENRLLVCSGYALPEPGNLEDQALIFSTQMNHVGMFEDQVYVEMERVWSRVMVSKSWIEEPEVPLRPLQSCQGRRRNSQPSYPLYSKWLTYHLFLMLAFQVKFHFEREKKMSKKSNLKSVRKCIIKPVFSS